MAAPGARSCQKSECNSSQRTLEFIRLTVLPWSSQATLDEDRSHNLKQKICWVYHWRKLRMSQIPKRWWLGWTFVSREVCTLQSSSSDINVAQWQRWVDKRNRVCQGWSLAGTMSTSWQAIGISDLSHLWSRTLLISRRQATSSYRRSFHSIFREHNETGDYIPSSTEIARQGYVNSKRYAVNIWSHLLGALFYSLGPLCCASAFSSRYGTTTATDMLVLSIYFSGVTGCFAFSTL